MRWRRRTTPIWRNGYVPISISALCKTSSASARPPAASGCNGPPGLPRRRSPAGRGTLIGERINSLSPKEFEVLRHFVRGESMMQVAGSLKRSVKTVSGQKISAMRKLDVRTDQELVAFCVEHGMFQ